LMKRRIPVGKRGTKPRLDEHEARRLCNRVIAGESIRSVGADYHLSPAGVRTYLLRGGVRKVWMRVQTVKP